MNPMVLIPAGVVFGVGSAIGSFLNVVIDRLPAKKSIVWARSSCDHCRRQLAWWEMAPVLSFMLLGGRCRTCRRKLSWQYPMVEFLAGMIGVVFYYQYSPTPELAVLWQDQRLAVLLAIRTLALLMFVGGLVVVSVIDLKIGIIPDEIILFLIWVVSIKYTAYLLAGLASIGSLTAGSLALPGWSVSHYGVPSDDWVSTWLGTDAVARLVAHQFFAQIWPGIVAGLFFFGLVVLTRGKGMGGGDVKLAFVIGLFLSGWQTLLAVYLAFVFGGVVVLGLLISGRRHLGQTVPFGPFLAFGAFVALFWHEELFGQYWQFVGR